MFFLCCIIVFYAVNVASLLTLLYVTIILYVQPLVQFSKKINHYILIGILYLFLLIRLKRVYNTNRNLIILFRLIDNIRMIFWMIVFFINTFYFIPYYIIISRARIYTECFISNNNKIWLVILFKVKRKNVDVYTLYSYNI